MRFINRLISLAFAALAVFMLANLGDAGLYSGTFVAAFAILFALAFWPDIDFPFSHEKAERLFRR